MREQVPLSELLRRSADDPLALARLAGILFTLGHRAKARELAWQASGAAPEDADIRSRIADILSGGVPRWHFVIVRDAARNAAYDAALRRAVASSTKVLEVGTGSGILAMMAARAGAKQVVTCEKVPSVAKTARDIVTSNGYTDRVCIIAKTSYEMNADRDMDGPADVLVSELIGQSIVGQDIMAVIEHAGSALLKPGAKIIPARGVVRVALAYDAGIDCVRMGAIDGFDLSAFNRLAPKSYGISRGSRGLRLQSAAGDLFDFDFQSGGPFPEQTAATTVVSNGGTANGVAQWIALQMDEDGWYENEPRPDATSAWAVVFWPFIVPRDYNAGETIKISGSHDRRFMRIWA